MPFELGLAVAVSLRSISTTHDWRVLEEKRHRFQQSLSDLGGYDAFVHGGTVRGLCDALLDVFDGLPSPPLQNTADLLWVYRRLRIVRGKLGSDIYRASAFRKLVVAAKAIVKERRLTAATAR